MSHLKSLAIISVIALISSAAFADETVGGAGVGVPPPRPDTTSEEPVTAPAPPRFALESTSVGLGIGVQWGEGTLHFEGANHSFSIQGLSVGDLGAARSIAFGEVENLESLSDFEGSYFGVEAGAAAGPGRTATTLRNANGVVLTLTSDDEGGRLRLGPEGLRIAID